MSGSFVLTASLKRADNAERQCFSLTRRARINGDIRRFVLRACRGQRVVRAVWAYNCPLAELDLVGATDTRAKRVEIELDDGSRRTAHRYTSPSAVGPTFQLFRLMTRRLPTGGGFVNDTEPRAIRAYDENGRLLGVKRHARGGGFSFDCFGHPAALARA
jgi:hypothetical protein